MIMDLIAWLEDLAAAYRIEPSEMSLRKNVARGAIAIEMGP
jgi:type II secretory pathway component PulM